MNAGKRKGKRVQVTVTLNPYIWEAVTAIAKQQDLTTSKIVDILLNYALECMNKEYNQTQNL